MYVCTTITTTTTTTTIYIKAVTTIIAITH